MLKTFLALLLSLIFSVQAFSDDKAHPKSKTKIKTILILGDSLTEGYGVEKEEAFPAQLLKIIKESGNKNIKVTAAGTSGSTSASAVKRLKWHLRKKPDYLILALGGNDGLRGLKPEATKENLSEAIKLAKSKNVKVFLAGMKIPLNYGEDYRSRFEKTFTDLAEEHDVSLIPFLLEGVGGEEELNLADGIHPNEKGHKIIAKTIYKNIKGSL